MWNLLLMELRYRDVKRNESWIEFPLYHTQDGARVYRSLQILTTGFNNTCRWLLLPAMQTFALVTAIVSTFVCTKFHAALPTPYILAFATSTLSAYAYECAT